MGMVTVGRRSVGLGLVFSRRGGRRPDSARYTQVPYTFAIWAEEDNIKGFRRGLESVLDTTRRTGCRRCTRSFIRTVLCPLTKGRLGATRPTDVRHGTHRRKYGGLPASQTRR